MAGALIAKAILGAIGGGFEGAAKPYSGGDLGIKANPTGAEKVGDTENKTEAKTETKADTAEKKDVALSSSALQNKTFQQSAPSMDMDKAGELFKNAKTSNYSFLNNFPSDETLKKIYGDNLSDKIIEDFAKISAIKFTYTPEAQQMYEGNPNVDDKEHTGVIAQELAGTESTESAVELGETGKLEVNTEQLTMTNAAAIAELSRRVLTLETAMKELNQRIKGGENA